MKQTGGKKRASVRNMVIIAPLRPLGEICHAVFYLKRKIKNRKGGGGGGHK